MISENVCMPMGYFIKPACFNKNNKFTVTQPTDFDKNMKDCHVAADCCFNFRHGNKMTVCFYSPDPPKKPRLDIAAFVYSI